MKYLIITLSILILQGCANLDSEEEEALFPDIATTEAYDITENSFFVGGVMNNEGQAIIEKGFVWGLAGTISDELTEFKVGEGSGDFEATINGLDSNTTYMVRAYIKTTGVILFGNVVEFTSL